MTACSFVYYGHSAQHTKDTEAAISDVQMPEVDPQVIGWHVGLVVGVDRDGVDVVGVGVGEHSPRAHFHHQVHWLQHRHLEESNLTEEWRDEEADSESSLNNLVCAYI